jgi:hypothetical protein
LQMKLPQVVPRMDDVMAVNDQKMQRRFWHAGA